MSDTEVSMISATLSEAKANFSKLLKQVQQGEVVTITSGREKTPVARLVSLHPAPIKRLGLLETPGFKLPDSFWEPMEEEELDLWDGGGE